MSYYETPADTKGYFYVADFVGTNGVCHFHASPEIVFVKEGTLDVLVGGERRTLGAGEGCFSDSFCLHGYGQSAPDAKLYVLLGEKTYFERVLSHFGGKQPPRFFRFEEEGLLCRLDGEEERFCNETPERAAFFSGMLSLLLIGVSHKTPFIERHADHKEELICSVLSYAEENLANELSLAHLSEHFGYSREHLSRLLSKYLSENWNSYLGRLRARRARQLIEDEGLPVTEAAFGAGFHSLNTFYRAYAREFGKPPVRG